MTASRILPTPGHGRIHTSERWSRCRFANVPFDVLSLDEAAHILARRDRRSSFEYVVTPNVDHLVRLENSDRDHLQAYDEALFSLCDSSIVWGMMRLLGRDARHAPGSDLVARIAGSVLCAGDHVTIVGCPSHIIDSFRSSHPGVIVHHHEPPMGFISDARAVEECLHFIESHPSRFIFLCVGSPRQEIIAAMLRARGKTTGVGLCCGGSIHFLTGSLPRAPLWMRKIGLEWLFRLLQEPHRLARRYLWDGPFIFLLFAREWRNGLYVTADQRG